MYLTAFAENLFVCSKESLICKPSFSPFLSGPRVAEIKVYAFYLALLKIVFKVARICTDKAKVIGKTLFELELKKNLLICCISRKGKIITPSGRDELLPGDGVIVVTTNMGLNDIDDILA